jgi:hypothetical protein
MTQPNTEMNPPTTNNPSQASPPATALPNAPSKTTPPTKPPPNAINPRKPQSKTEAKTNPPTTNNSSWTSPSAIALPKVTNATLNPPQIKTQQVLLQYSNYPTNKPTAKCNKKKDVANEPFPLLLSESIYNSTCFNELQQLQTYSNKPQRRHLQAQTTL